MIREPFRFRETIATILADNPAHVTAAKTGMLSARQVLERHIAGDPFFASSLEPYLPDSSEPVIVRMTSAATRAGVGPMAAVAGTIAWAGVEAMVSAGAAFGIIDNGGDIAFVSDRDVRVGVHAGDAAISNRIAFLLPPQDRILGICTSSATVGPSLSFGIADAVTVFSHDVALADAWATSVCNRIRPDDRSVLEQVSPDDVNGIFAIMGDATVRWGSLPQIVPAVVNEQLISAGDRI
jgi:ApbE superfamily uncharacterized protein (UPF0280 family)